MGNGKKLFSAGSIPAGFELLECIASPRGVIVASYKRSGEVKTGSFGMDDPSDLEIIGRKKVQTENTR